MANIKSQMKRNRQNAKLRDRNKAKKSALKTQIKRVREATEEGDTARAEIAYREAAQALDKAASKGIIHKNKAANQKSRLSRLVKSE